jgi:transposase
MRYGEGGGLTAEQRAKRERVRMAAAAMFADGASNVQVARAFRVSAMSVSRWRRVFDAAGSAGLVSKGPGGTGGKLRDEQVAELEAVLDAGPAAYGWDDQCWTLARIAALIAERFGVSYTLAGVAYLLHRLGWSVQAPARRAAERDEAAVAAWRDGQWPVVKGWRRTWARGSASKTKPVRGSGRLKAERGAGAAPRRP